jgi:hypothetical protein
VPIAASSCTRIDFAEPPPLVVFLNLGCQGINNSLPGDISGHREDRRVVAQRKSVLSVARADLVDKHFA